MGDQEPKDQNSLKSWGQYFALGMQLAGTVGLFVFLGYWLDSSRGWSPWGMVIGGFLGVAMGLYYFIRSVG